MDNGEMRIDPATVTARGTVAVPAGIGAALGLGESGELIFELDDSGVRILNGREFVQILKT